MNVKDSLGDRMKGYELVETDHKATPLIPLIVEFLFDDTTPTEE